MTFAAWWRKTSPPGSSRPSAALSARTWAARRGPASPSGGDNRFSSPDFYDALQKGLTASGCRVIGIGMVPTPVVSFATHHLDVAGAVQITGSHNPPEFNGFKITRGHEAIHGAEIQEIRKIIEEGRIHRPKREERSRKSTSDPKYIERASQYLALSRPVKVVVDAGNGVGGTVAPQVLRNIGAEVVELFTEPDASYPNHHPDPTVPKNLESLISKVRETGAEVGIGLDGDGDRIARWTPRAESYGATNCSCSSQRPFWRDARRGHRLRREVLIAPGRRRETDGRASGDERDGPLARARQDSGGESPPGRGALRPHLLRGWLSGL